MGTQQASPMRNKAQARRTSAITLKLLALMVIWPAPLTIRQISATQASLIGSVREPTGAPVADARIIARHLSTGQERSVSSDAEGNYRFSSLPVGEYEVRAEAKSFATYINRSITLHVGSATRLDIVLQPLAISAEVTVTERASPLDPTQTATTTTIEPEQIEELPINDRNYLQFVLLAPGVVAANPAGSALPYDGFSFGGLRPHSNAISIDGLDNTDETTGEARVALSPEIVREFQVVNNGVSAEFGGFAGGSINVVTKTGTNQFHGDLFTFLQHERLNAREPFAENEARPRFRRFQPGFSLGGPLKRDRLFFYMAAEQERLAGEDVSDVAQTVQARFNAILADDRRLAKILPFSERFPTGRRETEAAGKLTWLITPMHTLHLRYAYTLDRSRAATFNADLPTDRTARGDRSTLDHQATANLISTLSASLVNELRLQWSRRRASIAEDAREAGFEIVGIARAGRPLGTLGSRREDRQQMIETVTLGRSRHEWKAGASINHVSLRSALDDGFGGYFIFRTLDDLLAGRPAVWRQAFGDPHTELAVLSFGAFALDQWRPSSHLTLNLGARYDMERLPTPFRTTRGGISPRLGLVWNISDHTLVRTSFGIFRDRLPLAFVNRARQLDGRHAFVQIAEDSDAARIYGAIGLSAASAPFAEIRPSIYRPDPRFVMPYSLQTGFGIERMVAADTTLRADYLFVRGLHLPRTRNVNLLPPVIFTADLTAPLGVFEPTPQQAGRPVFSRARLDPRYDAIYQLEDSASSRYHGLTLALNRRFSDEFACLVSYTLARATDDASDFDEQPPNPFDLRSDWSSSREDLRHRLAVSALFDLPFAEEKESGWPMKIFKHVEVAPIATFSSGRRANPLTGSDEERSLAFPPSSRPLGARRNSLRAPANFNVDLRVIRYFPFGPTRRFDLVAEFFNLFNHPNALTVNPFYGSSKSPLPSFASPVLFSTSRQIRLSLDLEF
ncbi:MAG: TonB-dependent receptor [Pyrinomonas methylaliphatogenes]|nr:TonB-dependent receptor [Pyrinomonas methylaliphatogenes]